MPRGRKPIVGHQCKCGVTDPLLFYKHRKGKCKKCVIELTKNRLAKNPDISLKKIKYNLAYQQKNPFPYRIRAAQRRATVKGMDFNIDEAYLRELYDLQEGRCYYSGIAFELGSETIARRFGMSIDRIDSSKGYVKGNVVLAASIINSMKNDLSLDEFVTIAQTLVEYQKAQ